MLRKSREIFVSRREEGSSERGVDGCEGSGAGCGGSRVRPSEVKPWDDGWPDELDEPDDCGEEGFSGGLAPVWPGLEGFSGGLVSV
ncbi:MAG: hypothetical protein V2A66_07405 [Pseudomonadota bacterium]